MDLAESNQSFGTEYFMPPGAVIYRYRALIERAKQLVSIAQQVESAYLQFLEKLDIENYSVLKAEQDLGLASATVSLQNLRILEANKGVALAKIQADRVDVTLKHFAELLGSGLLQAEQVALDEIRLAGIMQSAGAAGALLGVVSAAGQGMATISAFNSMYASYKRREEEWTFQKNLAENDKRSAKLQQDIAEDRFQITAQERRISELSRDHATEVAAFLNNKFTNRELYAWMAGVVGQAYSYFLHQAASMAKLAQRQLAFERQEPDLGLILDDYWTYTRSGLSSGSGDERDRKGMTGSVRLLQDITRLDQHAFLTDRRRIPLPKHISLSTHDPVAFMRFRETGVLHIAT
jgi:Tc toxin complex TcA C-terminal TcB-binding domain